MTPKPGMGLAIVFLALVATLTGCGERRVTDKDIVFIQLPELREEMRQDAENPERLALVDARPPADFANGHIPGAINVRPQDLTRHEERYPPIAGHRMTVVYGENPGSAIATALTKSLMTKRYNRVRMFAGGIEAWTSAGLPLEKSQSGSQ